MSQEPTFFIQTRQENFQKLRVWEPPRRVLAIQASHRGGRGATNTVCEAMARGMESAGAQVRRVILSELEMKPCKGCFQCWVNEMGHCPQQDDLTTLLAEIPSYDLMFWALPLYVDCMPSLLKNLVDRMMILNHPAIVSQDGRCLHPSQHPAMPYLAIAAVCGFWSTENFAPLRVQMEALARNQHTPLLTFLQRPASLGLMLPEARREMERVEQDLEKAGRQLIEQGEVASLLAENIKRPLLSEERYWELAAGWWKK